MSTILFFVIIGCLALVLSWYLQNERADADGDIGLLAIEVEDEALTAEDGGSYRIKPKREVTSPDSQFLESRIKASQDIDKNTKGRSGPKKRFQTKSAAASSVYRRASGEPAFRKSSRVEPKKPKR